MSTSAVTDSSPWRSWLLASPFRTGIIFWSAYLLVNNCVNALSVIEDYQRRGLPIQSWEPFCWELSSALVILALIPGLAWVLDRFPLEPPAGVGKLAKNLAAQLLGSVVFSVLHVAGMVGLRNTVYALLGETYQFGNWGSEWVYEYRKDLITYASIIVALSLFRYFRHQQISPISHSPATEGPQRMLIRKRGREYLLQVADIEWAQAAGNYVTLHRGDELHPLRSTMAALEKTLPGHFCRVHRSAIVNIDCIAQITPQGSGDHVITLKSGAQVPFSRRYREAVILQISGAGP